MVHRNLLVGHGSARAALYRLDCVSYPFLSTADKRGWLRRLARLAFSVEADFSLYRVCRSYPAHTYAAEAAGMLDARRQDPEAWRELLAGHESHLRRLRSFAPEVYLAVSLKPDVGVAAGRGRARRSGPRAPPARSAARRRVRHRSPESELDALVGEEERVLRSRLGCVPARRATTDGGAVAAAASGVPRRLRADRSIRTGSPTALQIRTPDGRVAFEPLAVGAACGTSTRRSSRRTAAWSSTPRRRARFRRCSRSARCPSSPCSPGPRRSCSTRSKR